LVCRSWFVAWAPSIEARKSHTDAPLATYQRLRSKDVRALQTSAL